MINIKSQYQACHVNRKGLQCGLIAFVNSNHLLSIEYSPVPILNANYAETNANRGYVNCHTIR